MDGRQIEEIVDRALAEDWASGDVTTRAIIPAELEGKASIIAKARGVLAGAEVARVVFHRVDSSLRFDLLLRDGSEMQSGVTIAEVEGKVSSILRA